MALELEDKLLPPPNQKMKCTSVLFSVLKKEEEELAEKGKRTSLKGTAELMSPEKKITRLNEIQNHKSLLFTNSSS